MDIFFFFFWYEYVWWGRKVVFLLILQGFVELELRLRPLAFPLPLYRQCPVSPPSCIFIPPLEVIHFENSPFSVCTESLLVTRTLFSRLRWTKSFLAVVVGHWSRVSSLLSCPYPCNWAVCFSQSLKQSVHGDGTQEADPQNLASSPFMVQLS